MTKLHGHSDTRNNGSAGSAHKWHDYHQQQTTFTNGNPTPGGTSDTHGVYRRESGNVSGDVTSWSLRDGRNNDSKRASAEDLNNSR